MDDDRGECCKSDEKEKFRWFLSLSKRKKRAKDKENKVEVPTHLDKVGKILNHSVSDAALCKKADTLSQTKCKTSNMFYTLRKRFQKRFGAARNPEDDDVEKVNPSVSLSSHSIVQCSSNQQSVAAIVSESVATTSTVDNVPEVVETAAMLCSMPGRSERELVAAQEHLELAKHGWYWGNISRSDAQKRLAGLPNGFFLLRDSQTDDCQFALTFRSAGCTLHSRIDYRDGFWHIKSDAYKTVVSLIEETMQKSQDDVFCYVTSSSDFQPPFPVRLTHPVKRFFEVRPLQQICRHIIRQEMSAEQITSLPLPSTLRSYIMESC